MFSVVRNVGTYGKVFVDWEIASDDLVAGKTAETFNETKGTLVFGDGVKVRNVTLRVSYRIYIVIGKGVKESRRHTIYGTG